MSDATIMGVVFGLVAGAWILGVAMMRARLDKHQNALKQKYEESKLHSRPAGE